MGRRGRRGKVGHGKRNKRVSSGKISSSVGPVPRNLPEKIVWKILSWQPLKSLLSVCKLWFSLISSPNIIAKTQHNCAVNKSEISSSAVPVPVPGYLPEELLFDILSQLPVKSVLKLRSVCKSWLSLISSPNFVKTQYENQPSSVIVFGEEWSTELFWAEKSISLVCLDSVKNCYNVTVLKPPKPKPPMGCLMSVVGCCDGIVCIQSLGSFHLWNPATKKAKRFPVSVSPSHSPHCRGLGFDPLSGDYKVVRIFFGEGFVRYVHVYSANSRSWREILVEKLSIWERQILLKNSEADACVKGVLYWKLSRGMELVSFDLHTEEVRLIPMPSCVKLEARNDHLIDNRTCSVVNFRDCVAMIVYSRTKAAVSLWILDDGFGEIGISWTNKFTFEEVPPMVRLHGYLKTDKIVASDDAGLFLYDPKNKETKYLRISDRVLNAFEYTDSLVSIKGSKQLFERPKNTYRCWLIDKERAGSCNVRDGLLNVMHTRF